MNKKITFFGLLIAIFLAFIFFIKGPQAPKDSSSQNFPIASSSVSFSTSTKFSTTEIFPVNFVVSDKNYSVNVPVGSSIYDAMNILASTTDFSFKSDFYSGLGYFINEINGVKNSGGYYWTLYVDGKYSELGASSYKLLKGDSVEWKYENNNSNI